MQVVTELPACDIHTKKVVGINYCQIEMQECPLEDATDCEKSYNSRRMFWDCHAEATTDYELVYVMKDPEVLDRESTLRRLTEGMKMTPTGIYHNLGNVKARAQKFVPSTQQEYPQYEPISHFTFDGMGRPKKLVVDKEFKATLKMYLQDLGA